MQIDTPVRAGKLSAYVTYSNVALKVLLIKHKYI